MNNAECVYKCRNLAVIIIWGILYIGFIVAGGYIINELEQSHDYEGRNAVRERLLRTIRKHNFAPNDTVVMEIMSAAIDAHGYGVSHMGNLETNLTSVWDWCSGVFFCNSLVTTVGYGNIYPRTSHGKLFSIFYSIIGIIIFATFLIKLGYACAKVIERCDGFWKTILTPRTKRKKRRKKPNTKMKILIVQLVITIILSMILIWLIPAFALTQVEGWSFLTSLYFCIITLTTIGLGDIAPWERDAGGQYKGGQYTGRETVYQYVTIAYIFVGLAALSTILNLLSSVVCDAAINQAQNILHETKKIIVENTFKVENMLVQTKERIKDSTDAVEMMLRQTKDNVKDSSLIVEDMLLQTKEKVKHRNYAVADLLRQTKAKIKDSNNLVEDMLQETKEKMKGNNVLVEDMLANTKHKIDFHSMRGGTKMKPRDSISTVDGFTMRQTDRIKAASKMIRGSDSGFREFVGSKLRGSLQNIKQSRYLAKRSGAETSDTPDSDTPQRKGKGKGDGKGENPNNIFIKIVSEKSKNGVKETIYDS